MTVPVVNLTRTVARVLVHLWPTDVGLWRIRQCLPATGSLPREMVTKLRGFPLRLRYHPRTYLGWYLFYRGMYEDKIIRTCYRLLRPGMTFVDVGANIGLYSVVASHAVGPSGRVIAVEPQPILAAVAVSNAELNFQYNIDVRTCALGETAGNAILYQTSSTNDGAATLRLRDGEKSFGESIGVEVETLSNLLRDCRVSQVSGMKIDVEGAELSVLKGFTEELMRSPPEFIFVECIGAHLRRFGAIGEDVLRFLRGFGFDLLCLYRGRWRHVGSPAEQTICGHSPDLLAVRPGTPSWERFAPVLCQPRQRK